MKIKLYFLNSNYYHFLFNKNNLTEMYSKQNRPYIAVTGIKIGDIDYIIPLTTNKHKTYINDNSKYAFSINDRNNNEIRILKINKMLPILLDKNFVYEPSFNDLFYNIDGGIELIEVMHFLENENNINTVISLANEIYQKRYNASQNIINQDLELKYAVDFKKVESLMYEYSVEKNMNFKKYFTLDDNEWNRNVLYDHIDKNYIPYKDKLYFNLDNEEMIGIYFEILDKIQGKINSISEKKYTKIEILYDDVDLINKNIKDYNNFEEIEELSYGLLYLIQRMESSDDVFIIYDYLLEEKYNEAFEHLLYSAGGIDINLERNFSYVDLDVIEKKMKDPDFSCLFLYIANICYPDSDYFLEEPELYKYVKYEVINNPFLCGELKKHNLNTYFIDNCKNSNKDNYFSMLEKNISSSLTDDEDFDILPYPDDPEYENEITLRWYNNQNFEYKFEFYDNRTGEILKHISIEIKNKKINEIVLKFAEKLKELNITPRLNKEVDIYKNFYFNKNKNVMNK